MQRLWRRPHLRAMRPTVGGHVPGFRDRRIGARHLGCSQTGTRPLIRPFQTPPSTRRGAKWGERDAITLAIWCMAKSAMANGQRRRQNRSLLAIGGLVQRICHRPARRITGRLRFATMSSTARQAAAFEKAAAELQNEKRGLPSDGCAFGNLHATHGPRSSISTSTRTPPMRLSRSSIVASSSASVSTRLMWPRPMMWSMASMMSV